MKSVETLYIKILNLIIKKKLLKILKIYNNFCIKIISKYCAVLGLHMQPVKILQFHLLCQDISSFEEKHAQHGL